MTTRMSFPEPLTLNKTRTKLIISLPCLAWARPALVVLVCQQAKYWVSLEPSLCLPHSTAHQSPSTQSQNLGVALQSTVVSCWKHPAASLRTFRGSNPKPKHACLTGHFLLSPAPCWLSRSLKRLQPGWISFSLKSHHFLPGLQAFARPDPFARYKPSSLFPHLANSSLPFKSQLSHASSRNPSLTPRNPGGCLPWTASVCLLPLY